MRPQAPPFTGCFGLIPRERGFVGHALPSSFTDRWDRWFTLATRDAPPDSTGAARPVWRFRSQPGLFGPTACSGAWRMSRDRDGQVYPFVLAHLGAPPAPDDRWFDMAARIVAGATDGSRSLTDIRAETDALRPPPAGPDPDGAMLMWRDDWEVHELGFRTGQAFAEFGLPGAA
ncbi:MAG: type VI secretion system-associated protein TagF [Tabrizicola sp.]|nr:type VI secretion system-associated protein TagF [Tabrizicola sp.]